MKVAIVTELVFAGCFLPPRVASANDSFAEVAVGKNKLLKHADIVLQKEVLTIRPNKVDVVYRFFNPTDKDITITVAFPLPAYSYKPDSAASSPTYDFKEPPAHMPPGTATPPTTPDYPTEVPQPPVTSPEPQPIAPMSPPTEPPLPDPVA